MADLPAAFLAQRGWLRFLAIGMLGACAGLGQAPSDFWVLTVAALGAVFWLYPAFATSRQAGWHLWAFGCGYFALSLRWIVSPFLVDIARHGWMAPFALLLMAAGAALFWAFAGWVAARVAPRSALALGLALVGTEMLRAHMLSGFPWALLGHV